MNWVTIVGGISLLIAPFASGYSGSPAALWTNLIMGMVVVVLGYMKNYKWAAVAGLLTFFAPLVFVFNNINAALWNCLTIGGVIAITDGYQGFFKASGTRKKQRI